MRFFAAAADDDETLAISMNVAECVSCYLRCVYLVSRRPVYVAMTNFNRSFLSQITRKDRPLYIQTANCVEEKEWVDLLNKVCENNKRRLDTFHPCAFISGEWTW